MTTVTLKKYSVCQCVLPLIGPNVVIHELWLCKGKVCMTNKHCILPLNGPNVVFMSYAKVKCAGQMTNKQKLQFANVFCL